MAGALVRDEHRLCARSAPALRRKKNYGTQVAVFDSGVFVHGRSAEHWRRGVEGGVIMRWYASTLIRARINASKASERISETVPK
jgi:hypothetical protein